MILATHMCGNEVVRHAVLALAEAGLLAEYWTCASWNPDWPLARFVPRRLRHQLERRSYRAEIRPFIRHHPWRELGRMAASQLGWSAAIRHETGPFCMEAVFASLDQAVARRLRQPHDIRGVFSCEDGALACFTEARRQGLRTIYEQPIGYWRAAQQVYAEEAEREPAWAVTLTGRQDSPAKLARKDAELELADVAIAASTFTRETLRLAPRCPETVHVIPYGAPRAISDAPPVQTRSGPLRVLFVGSLGQRKGLSYLLQAVEQLGRSVELTLIGRQAAAGCRPLEAALARHRWVPSLPHRGVLEEMAAHDVLVFPSLFEGFGLVILEAMGQGLPVIATPHTAGPDLITDGVDGFIVPIRDSAAIVEKLDLLGRDPSLLSRLKTAARAAAHRHTWATYQSQFTQAIRLALST